MSTTIGIGGELEPKTTEKIGMRTDYIQDDTQNKTQKEINADTMADLTDLAQQIGASSDKSDEVSIGKKGARLRVTDNVLTIDTTATNDFLLTNSIELKEGDKVVINCNTQVEINLPIAEVLEDGTYGVLFTPTGSWTSWEYTTPRDLTAILSVRASTTSGETGWSIEITSAETGLTKRVHVLEDGIINLNTIVENNKTELEASIETKADQTSLDAVSINVDTNTTNIGAPTDKSSEITAYTKQRSLIADPDDDTKIIIQNETSANASFCITNEVKLKEGDTISAKYGNSLRKTSFPIAEVFDDGTYGVLVSLTGSAWSSFEYTVPKDMTVILAMRTSSTAEYYIKIYSAETGLTKRVTALEDGQSIIADIKEDVEKIELKESNLFAPSANSCFQQLRSKEEGTYLVKYYIDITTGKITSTTSAYNIHYAAVKKGDRIYVKVNASDDSSSVRVGFTTETPDADVDVTNITSYATTDLIEGIYFAPADGWIVVQTKSDRSISRVRYAEIGDGDYFAYSKYYHKLSSLKLGGTTNMETSNNSVSLVVVGDPHGGTDNMQRILDFSSRYNNLIDDTLIVGDMQSSKYGAAGSVTPFDSLDGFNKVLMAIGNHDIYNYDNLAPEDESYAAPDYRATDVQKYTKYMKDIADWGVTQPDDAETNGACYYYKDYSIETSVQNDDDDYSKQNYVVRLIVLDGYQRKLTDEEKALVQAQYTWLETVLNDALSMSTPCHVICAIHQNAAPTTSYDNSGWTEDKTYGADTSGIGIPIYEKVQSFIDNGGNFVCWLHGHRHVYNIGKYTDYPEQLSVTLGCANADGSSRKQCVSNLEYDASYDNFAVLNIDPSMKRVRLMKVGCEYDRNLKHRNTLVLSYDTDNLGIVYEG